MKDCVRVSEQWITGFHGASKSFCAPPRISAPLLITFLQKPNEFHLAYLLGTCWRRREKLVFSLGSACAAHLSLTLYLDNSGCLLDSSRFQRSWIKQAHRSEIPLLFCNYYISRLLAVIRNGLTRWVLGLLPWSTPRGCPDSALASIRKTLLPFNLVARKHFLLPCHNSTVFEETASMLLFHS